MNVAERARDYLKRFSNKDLAGLEALFAPDVTLRDWDVGVVQGRDAVLAVNAKLFAAVGTLEARPVEIHVAGTTAITELEVHIDGKLAVLVADVIDFDANGRIKHVRAYRGT